MDARRGTGASGFQKEQYDNLRKEVQELKLQQRESSKTQARTKDSLALQQVKEDMLKRTAEYESRLEGMQKHSREVAERATRARTQHERERSAQAAKADKLARSLEEARASHKSELEALGKGFDDDKKQLKALLQRAQETQEQLLDQRDAAWRQQQSQDRADAEAAITMMRREHEQRLQTAAGADAARVRELDAMRKARDAATAEKEEAEEREADLQRQVRALEEALSLSQNEWREERKRLQKRNGEALAQVDENDRSWSERLMREKMDLQDQLEEYRRSKESDMDLIHARLKAVVSSRDATIRQLRAELGDTRVQLSQLQGFMQQRSREMLGGAGGSPGGSPGRHQQHQHSVLSVRPGSPAQQSPMNFLNASLGASSIGPSSPGGRSGAW